MIVIGNLPSSKYVNNIYTKTVNILHGDGEENRVKRKLKLLESPVKTTKMSQLYMKGNRKFVLHNVRSLPALEYLYNREFPGSEFKLASTYLQYLWSRAFSKFPHTDVYEWVDTARLFSKLHRDFFSPGIQEESHARAMADADRLFFLAGDYALSAPNMTAYKPWNTYTRESVLDAMSSEGRSIYQELLKAPHKCNLPILRDKLDLEHWMSLTMEEKISATLERVYSDIANEYLFDTDALDMEDSTEKYIMEGLMHAQYRQSDPWFSMFIRIHFDDIMAEADLGIIDYIQWSQVGKQLVKIAD